MKEKSTNKFLIFAVGVAIGVAIVKLINFINEHKAELCAAINAAGGDCDDCDCDDCNDEDEAIDDIEPDEEDVNPENYNAAAADLSDIVEEINNDSNDYWEMKK